MLNIPNQHPKRPKHPIHNTLTNTLNIIPNTLHTPHNSTVSTIRNIILHNIQNTTLNDTPINPPNNTLDMARGCGRTSTGASL